MKTKATEKFNFSQPKGGGGEPKQQNLKNNLEMNVIKDMLQIWVPLPKIMSMHNPK